MPFTILHAHARHVLRRSFGDEQGQTVLTWLVVMAVLWLVLTGSRVVVQ